MVYKTLTLFFLLFSVAFGVSQEVEDIKSYYKSLARDFLIYEYAKKEDISKEDLKALQGEIYRYRGKIKSLFDRKLKKKYPIFDCKTLTSNSYITHCVKPYLTPSQVAKMSTKRVKKLYLQLPKKDRKYYHWVKAMLAKDTFKALQYGSAKDFLKVFNGVSQKYKYKVLDKYLNLKFATKLSKVRGFDRFVMIVAMDKNYKKLPISLAKIDPKNLSFNGSFYLGLISLKDNNPKKALRFFQNAKKNTKKKSNKDKALFWEYQVTKDKKTLLRLANGSDLNFYTFWAKEKLGLKNIEIIEPKPQKVFAEDFNITDPFMWAKINDKTKNLDLKSVQKYAKKLYTKSTIAHYTFILERAGGYKKSYFITPYKELLGDVDKKRKILIYSIARQESRFVPASVSTSYALGLMQFMPFLALATAKDEKIENFKYFDMFKPKIALQFANNHLDFLEKYLYNPLLIAYAYNGGIGFTKKLLTQRGLFKKGKYEPFLSMELVNYSESREYGKKVLVNYVLYGRIFGLHVSLFELLDNLLIDKKSHGY